MYPCAQKYVNNCSCANKNKYARNHMNEDNIQLIHEPPVRDTAKRSAEINYENNSAQFPPPGPPNGDGLWELQYCKWWGWTWVRKGDKQTVHRSSQKSYGDEYLLDESVDQEIGKQKHGGKKKSKSNNRSHGFLSCFKKKQDQQRMDFSPRAQALSSQQPLPQAPPPLPIENENETTNVIIKRQPNMQANDTCCCCCCCCCQTDYQMCPCMCHQNCCCCCSFEDDDDEQLSSSVKERRYSKNSETQTLRDVREQATKMSEMQVPKHRNTQAGRGRCQCKCQRKRCVKPMCCCRCMRNVCCPCPQKTQNNSFNGSSTNDKIINYCLTSNLRKPSLSDLFKFKQTNFSALHKSVDILLKNNMNIMSIFSDKKFSKQNDKTPNFLDANLSSLSLHEIPKKSEQEHSKLLTAVCDAILSSHKFDDERYNPLKLTSSKSTEKSFESQNSSNGILDKILNDLNFPMSTHKTRSYDEINNQNNIGMQVNNATKKKIERPHRALTRLTKSKSKLTMSRFPKRIDAIRSNLDLLKTRIAEGKNIKKSSLKVSFDNTKTSENQKVNDHKSITNIFNSSNESILSKSYQPVKFDFTSFTLPTENGFSKFRSVDEVLASINFNLNSTDTNLEQTDDKNRSTSSFHDDSHLLDTTSPPFTDDLAFNVEEKTKETTFNEEE